MWLIKDNCQYFMLLVLEIQIARFLLIHDILWNIKILSK